eukprot:15355127-Ditylum_brightwellii.AAC.1
MISAMLKELNITKPITSNINTYNSIMISTITGEDNSTTMLKDNTVKEISDDNTNSTATSLHDSSSKNDSSDPEGDNDYVKEMPQTAPTQKNQAPLLKQP